VGKVLGKEHPHTLMSASNLAAVLVKQGDYEAAEEINRRVVDGREKVLGRSILIHYQALVTWPSYSSIRASMGRRRR